MNATGEPSLPPRLVYGSDEEPGLGRRGPTNRFRYVDERTGRPVTDRATLERVRALVIPPAWTDVWIAADPRSHIQATGRDARRRKQYRYHPEFRAHQEEAKFELLVPFGRGLSGFRRRVERDLRRRGLPHERVLALVVRLLEQTVVRVGNEEYARQRLVRAHHAARSARHGRWSRLRLRFPGKSSKAHDVGIDDPRLVRLVRRCQDLPGQLLFQHAEGDHVRSHRPTSTSTCAPVPVSTSRPRSSAPGTRPCSPPWRWPTCRLPTARAERAVSSMLKASRSTTPRVCRASYVHPVVIDRYLDGSLAAVWAGASRRDRRPCRPTNADWSVSCPHPIRRWHGQSRGR